MTFTEIQAPPSKGATGSGFKISLTESKTGGQKVRLIVGTAAQQRVFGGSIHGKGFSAQAGRGPHEGQLRLVPGDGPLKAAVAGKGSATIWMQPWDLLPKGKRTGVECKVIEVGDDGSVTLQLPTWARPSSADGKLGDEFALKKV